VTLAGLFVVLVPELFHPLLMRRSPKREQVGQGREGGRWVVDGIRVLCCIGIQITGKCFHCHADAAAKWKAFYCPLFFWCDIR